ncbi:small heat shock protein 12.6identical [Aphelenchoides avenae]|nr:small heat shock protein 12.6identical [Aphelenchus avenae]
MSVEISHDWSTDHWDWPLQHADGVVKVNNAPDKWEVGLDAGFFTPKEIEASFYVTDYAPSTKLKEQNVKVHGENLIVHLHHGVRNDEHGDVSREITRTYRLPPDVDTTTIKSHLNQRGVLNISAQKKH